MRIRPLADTIVTINEGLVMPKCLTTFVSLSEPWLKLTCITLFANDVANNVARDARQTFYSSKLLNQMPLIGSKFWLHEDPP